MSKISLLRGETKLVCYLCLCLRVCLCPCWFTHTCICDHGSNPRTGCFLSSRCMCVCVSVCLCLCLRACLRVCLCPRSCTHKHVYALTASDRMIETLSYIRDKCEYFLFLQEYLSIYIDIDANQRTHRQESRAPWIAHRPPAHQCIRCRPATTASESWARA